MKSRQKQEPSWPDVLKILERLDQADLLALISDLYRLSNDNKDFLHARFAVGGDVLAPYKKVIKECMHPDIMNESVRIPRAKQAIRDYSKAVSDVKGEAELLTYFVECGNKFTIDYGDINEEFYDTLMEIFSEAIKKVLTLPAHEQDHFRKRLKKIMLSSNGIGWGYHDGLCDEYYGSFKVDD